jgi:hypothetical protein
MPSSKEGIVMVALSVSTSAMSSSIETVSPSLLSHFTRVPSLIVSLSLGIFK